MTITRSLLLAVTWLALAALVTYITTVWPAVLALCCIITVWGVRNASKVGPGGHATADRPTLRPGFMARFGEVEKTCCHGHAK